VREEARQAWQRFPMPNGQRLPPAMKTAGAMAKVDGLVEKIPSTVTPAPAGVYKLLIRLDPGFRRDDAKHHFWTFYESIKVDAILAKELRRQRRLRYYIFLNPE
jgi:hypothetical protein